MGGDEQHKSLNGTIAPKAWRAVKRVLVGIGSLPLFLMSASSFGSGQKIVLLGVFALWIILRCSILVHESGHAIAAKLIGWRVLVFAVNPLSWNVLTRRLGRAHRIDDADVGGWVVAVPRDPAAVTRARYALFVVGGPVANLLLAVVAFWAASTWLPAYDYPNLSVSTLAGTTGFVSAMLSIFNLFPSSRVGLLSDGDHLRRIWRADAGWHKDTVIASLAAVLRYGARPRDRPHWMLNALRSMNSEEAEKAADGMDISAALDAPPVDVAKVRSMIDLFRKGYGDSEWLSSCDAYLAAVWENDVGRARTVRWHGEGSDDQRPLRLAVDAAIAAREGDTASAKGLLQNMRIAASAEPWMRPVFRDIDRQIGALLADT